MTHHSSIDFSCYAVQGGEQAYAIFLHVEGMVCGSCVWDIERALNAEPEVKARVNLSSRRLSLQWQGGVERCNQLIEKITKLGYRLLPFDMATQEMEDKEEAQFLLKCLAVSGFAAGNIMLFSIALWFHGETIGEATKTLLHWVSALVALPSIVYAGQPFFRSAFSALSRKRTNMDVPISVALVLTSSMSLFETIRHGEYVYFDSSIMLLFFLLSGRFLDRKARGRVRLASSHLLATFQGTASIIENGKSKSIAIRDIKANMLLRCTAGEKIASDGIVVSGISDMDTSLVTGETLPKAVKQGDRVFAGMINLTSPLEIKVTTTSDKSLLAAIVRLMEVAEQSKAKYIRLADKIAGYYTPVVHLLGGCTFVFWWLVMGVAWQKALLIATTVLIITCPCALALAIPVVQVIASGKLFKQGILLKSADALERLIPIDTVVFDKTGTLTLGKPILEKVTDEKALQLAASLAVHSKHPLSKAVAEAWQGELLDVDVEEIPGCGLEACYNGKTIRLGKGVWCGASADDNQQELWLSEEGRPPHRFTFSDQLREDAKDIISTLKHEGKEVILLSGDREAVVTALAHTLGITHYRAALSPIEKSEYIDALKVDGRHVLMVGDGMNDAPALATAHVSIAPSTAMDISQHKADVVFQGDKLTPILTVSAIARSSNMLVKQNLLFTFMYNLAAVPLAMLGLVTPLVAAIAMSGSSLAVIVNAFRLKEGKQ